MHANTTQRRSGHLRPLAATVTLLGLATTAQAGLANSGFEVNTLTSIGHVVGGSFPANSAVWGQESSTITGAMDGITPYGGSRMLRMTSEGGVLTQTAQLVDVSAQASTINSGATFNFEAWFNAPKAGAIGGLGMQFFSGNNYGTQIGTPVFGNLNLDADASTWQARSIGGLIPTGTLWMMAQVYYVDSSLANALGSQPGFVDSAQLSISAVPEVPTYGMLCVGLAMLGAVARRWRPPSA